jgi:hypothetical protein
VPKIPLHHFLLILFSNARWHYDVFLSFRGEDTRKNFTDHLYAALHQRGIIIFRDDLNLKRGKSIAPELLKAIEGSRILVRFLKIRENPLHQNSFK